MCVFIKFSVTRQLTKSKKKEPKKAFRIDFTAEISENEFLPGKVGYTCGSESACVITYIRMYMYVCTYI